MASVQYSNWASNQNPEKDYIVKLQPLLYGLTVRPSTSWKVMNLMVCY